LKEAGLLDAQRRSFNRWALAPSLVVLFLIAVVPAI
jgi:multiple sugar transport system permease protein